MGSRMAAWTVGATVVLGGLALVADAAPQGPGSPRCVRFPATGAERAPLDKGQRAAIVEALQDEYQGEAVYARVLKDHGVIRPFSNVVHAERRHAEYLENLLESRGLPVPENRWAAAEVPTYASWLEACAAAVEFEARNVALYDRLLAAGPLPDDARQVFEHNRMASLDHHKPAFEMCAAGGRRAAGAGVSGRGRRGGGGRGCGGGWGCGYGCRQGGGGWARGRGGWGRGGGGWGRGGGGWGRGGGGWGRWSGGGAPTASAPAESGS